MKRLILMAAAAVLATACGGGAAKYTLRGTVDTLYNGTYVTLSRGGGKIDSVLVADGAFVFEGRIDTPAMAGVMVAKGEQYATCVMVLEAGEPTVSLEGKTPVWGGTPLNERYYRYTTTNQMLQDGYMADVRSLFGNKELAVAERTEQINARTACYIRQRDSLTRALFAANTDNVLGAMAMTSLEMDKSEFDSLYNVAGEVVRREPRVVAEKQRYDNLEKTSAGKMFTDFTIEHGAADGSAASLSDYVGRGKYVLADFWASWCGPCRGEMPNLAEVYKKYKGDRFEIVGVAVWDERADTEKALTELPITWPVIYDAQEIPVDLYGIRGIPEIILFGPDGTIVARGLRGEAIGTKVGECLSGK